MNGGKGKVFVGLSGGVDSSVAAALLKKRGCQVEAVFIRVWQPEWKECSWKEDRLDAMRVAVRLGIPFHTLDLDEEYKREVVDYMIREYRSGRTPNPDVLCNRKIKFGAFLRWARQQGASFVATGHYARIRRTKTKWQKNQFELLTSKDKNKDQTYFLWTLTERELPYILFPVGEFLKSEVRQRARQFGLITADKKDSQGLCFIGKIDFKEFLSHYIEAKKGTVLNERGEIIGSHEGALFYTIGQRRGFNVTKKAPEGKRLYVVGKDMGRNTLTVSEKSPDGILHGATRNLIIESVNWISDPHAGRWYHGRVRYRQPLQPAKVIELGDGKVLVSFKVPQSVAAGQSVVLYDRGVCLGGGIISA